MKQFEEKKFNIPELKGISKKNIEEHLKLYSGYVKNSNTILEKIEEMKKDAEKNAYAISEVQRRFGFDLRRRPAECRNLRCRCLRRDVDHVGVRGVPIHFAREPLGQVAHASADMAACEHRPAVDRSPGPRDRKDG